MIILVSGGCKNGKSSYAQELAVNLSVISDKECNSSTEAGKFPLIYFATMIPHDSEDDERIKKHREDRKNMGFKTIECGKNIVEAAEKLEAGSVVLFDSLTALVANEMFENDSGSEFPGPDEYENFEKKITQKLQHDLKILMERAGSVVFVSDAIFSDGKIYDETTELYRRILAKTENFVAQNSGNVVEMVSKLQIENGKTGNSCGKGLNREGVIPQNEILETKKSNFQFSTFNFQLILGGAYQGKTAWAKEKFALSDDDIFACGCDSLPDFSKRCITHYENYIAYCLKNGIEPKTDFRDLEFSFLAEKSGAGEKLPEKIIICDDIFCGVVPIDSFQRKLREVTGLALQKIAEYSEVTRIFCGKAQRLN